MTHLDITVISDMVCPHCYIGRARLHRAVSLYRKTVPGGSRAAITTTWQAYLLDASAPRRVSEPIAAVAARRFGADRLGVVERRLRQLGVQDGLCVNLDGRLGSSTDAHRLVILAKQQQQQQQQGGGGGGGGAEMADALVGELMRLHFEGEGDITKHEDLIVVAGRAGLDRDVARAWLDGAGGEEEVAREDREAKAMGVEGVPRFVINGEFVVDGAQDVSDILEQLVKAKEAQEAAETVA